MSINKAPDSLVINAVAIKKIPDIKHNNRDNIYITSNSFMIVLTTPPIKKIIPTISCSKNTILKKILKLG